MFCYHKAADLRICQAAYSLSCVRSCSALPASRPPESCLEILNQRLTVPQRVWSLTGSPPSDLIGLYEQHMNPHPPPNTHLCVLGRTRRKHGGNRGHPEEAESHPEEVERRKKDRKREGGEGGGDQPNQRLGGTSGQRPTADSQRQTDNEPTTPRGAEREKRTQTADKRRREGWRDSSIVQGISRNAALANMATLGYVSTQTASTG